MNTPLNDTDTLTKRAFRTAINAQIETSRNTGQAPSANEVAIAFLRKLGESQGKNVELSERRAALIRYIFNPTATLRWQLLEGTAADAGVELNSLSSLFLIDLLNPSTFAEVLKRAGYRPPAKETPRKRTKVDREKVWSGVFD